MPDLQHVNQGDPIAIRAETWNAMLDAVAEENKKKLGDEPNTPLKSTIVPCLMGIGVNKLSGSGPLAALNIVTAAQSPPIDPNINPLDVRRRPFLNLVAPNDASSPVMVVQDAMVAGDTGRVIVGGLTVAPVNLSDSSHLYAFPTKNQTGFLQSGNAGSVRLLAGTFVTGISNYLVLIGQPSGGPIYRDDCVNGIVKRMISHDGGVTFVFDSFQGCCACSGSNPCPDPGAVLCVKINSAPACMSCLVGTTWQFNIRAIEEDLEGNWLLAYVCGAFLGGPFFINGCGCCTSWNFFGRIWNLGWDGNQCVWEIVLTWFVTNGGQAGALQFCGRFAIPAGNNLPVTIGIPACQFGLDFVPWATNICPFPPPSGLNVTVSVVTNPALCLIPLSGSCSGSEIAPCSGSGPGSATGSPCTTCPNSGSVFVALTGCPFLAGNYTLNWNAGAGDFEYHGTDNNGHTLTILASCSNGVWGVSVAGECSDGVTPFTYSNYTVLFSSCCGLSATALITAGVGNCCNNTTIGIQLGCGSGSGGGSGPPPCPTSGFVSVTVSGFTGLCAFLNGDYGCNWDSNTQTFNYFNTLCHGGAGPCVFAVQFTCLGVIGGIMNGTVLITGICGDDTPTGIPLVSVAGDATPIDLTGGLTTNLACDNCGTQTFQVNVLAS